MEQNEELIEQKNKVNSLSVLDSNTKDIIEKVMNENDPDKLKDLTELFNQNMMKKNIIRIAKNNKLLDDVNAVAEERIELMSDSLSNREITDYMKAFQSQIQTSQEAVESIKNGPMIKPSISNTTININGASISRESQDRVLEFIKQFMNEENEETEIIDISNEGDNN